jgi:hypothetical protein
MKLDQTHIVVRRRTASEICDLALHASRDHAGPLLLLLFVGAAPWFAVNYFLIGWMVSDDYVDVGGYSFTYFWSMILLVTAQAQMGTVFIAKYLGEATFVGRPKISHTIKSVLNSSWMLFSIHFFSRLLIVVLLIALLFLSRTVAAVAWAAAFLLPITLAFVVGIRLFRPFANEIVLLEQTPFDSRDPNQVVYGKRSASLHSVSSNVFGRGLLSCLVAIPCFVIFCTFINIIKIILLLGYEWSWFTQAVCIPLGMWLTAGFMAVVRFLNYIDARIYQEGWDVELKIRAEALKLREKLV